MFICSLVGGHLDHFHFLASMTEAALSIHVYIFWCICVFVCVWVYLEVRLLGHRAGIWLVVVGTSSFSKVVLQISSLLIVSESCYCSIFSTILGIATRHLTVPHFSFFQGFMLLAGRVRKQEEVNVIQEVLEKHFKKKLCPQSLFSKENVLKLLGEWATVPRGDELSCTHIRT